MGRLCNPVLDRARDLGELARRFEMSLDRVEAAYLEGGGSGVPLPLRREVARVRKRWHTKWE